MMLKRVLILLVTLLLPFLAQAANSPKELNLMLEWFVNPDHGPIIIAEKNGYFEKEGVKVNIQEPGDPNMPPKLVAAGDVDLAVYYQPSLTHGAASGMPIAWAGTLIASPLDGIIVLEDGPIKSPKDLKGKTIGLSISGNEAAYLNTVFRPYGFGVDDVKLVNVGWNLSSSLLTGRVDALIGAYRNFELNQLELEGKKGTMFYYEENNVPAYDQLIFIANSKKQDKEAIRRFLRGVELGAQYIINNPEKSWDIFKSYNPKQLDNELNKRAWSDTIPHFALRPAARDVGRYQRFSDFMVEAGGLEKAPKASSYMLTLD